MLQILPHSNEVLTSTPANTPANGPASSWKLVVGTSSGLEYPMLNVGHQSVYNIFCRKKQDIKKGNCLKKRKEINTQKKNYYL